MAFSVYNSSGLKEGGGNVHEPSITRVMRGRPDKRVIPALAAGVSTTASSVCVAGFYFPAEVRSPVMGALLLLAVSVVSVAIMVLYLVFSDAPRRKDPPR